MKEFKLVVKVGDLIEVGRFRNVSTKIKKIELDECGQPVIITLSLIHISEPTDVEESRMPSSA